MATPTLIQDRLLLLPLSLHITVYQVYLYHYTGPSVMATSILTQDSISRLPLSVHRIVSYGYLDPYKKFLLLPLSLARTVNHSYLYPLQNRVEYCIPT